MVTAVNKGFVKYEVGEFPEDWNVILIGDSLKFKNGLNKESECFGYGTPIVNYMDVFNNHGIRQKNIEGKVFLNREEINSFSAKKGDVFFTRTSETQKEIGNSAVLLENIDDCVFSGFILRGRPKNNIVLPEYYQYCLIPNYVRNQIISTSSYTTRALTNGRFLSKIKLIIPPTLEEQKTIATTLSDVDDLITNLDKLISKKKDIKQGTMQQLLTPPHKGGRRLPGFSGDWEKKQLKSCLKYEQPSKYIVQNSDYEGQSQTPVLTAGKSFLLGYTDEDFGIFNHYPVIIFDDFTTSKQLVNFSFKVKSSAMKMLLPASEEIDINFMFSLMNLIRFSLGDDHKRRWIAEYSKINVFVPEKDEQQAISKILSDMEDEINELETKKEKHQSIKQGMMQELLTGKTRLI